MYIRIIHTVWLQNQASSENTPNCPLRNSQFSSGAVGWLPRATLAALADYLHIILRHVPSSYVLACTQTSCFLELPIPPTDALSTRWINSVASAKLTLHCDYRFTHRTLQHTKRLLLYGRHFLTDCRGTTATVEPSRGDFLRLGAFLFHLEDAKWIHGWWLRNYACLKWDESFWITLNHAYFMYQLLLWTTLNFFPTTYAPVFLVVSTMNVIKGLAIWLS
jgi:hypothetical protein